MTTIQPKWYGIIICTKEGVKAKLNDSARYQRYLDTHYKVGDKISITIKKNYRTRTTNKLVDGSNQNGYYWAVVVELISAHTGLTKYEVHAEIKRLFFSEPHPKYPMILVPGTTTDADSREWEERMEQIRAWAAVNLELRIPLPNEVDVEK